MVFNDIFAINLDIDTSENQPHESQIILERFFEVYFFVTNLFIAIFGISV